MLRVYVQGKFISFESFRSGIFQIEFSVFNEKIQGKIDFNNLNFCIANNERLYDNTEINQNPIDFLKTIVKKKKETNLNLSIINQLERDLASFIVTNLSKFLNLNNLKEIYLETRIEDDLKILINKRIGSEFMNYNANRFDFAYIIKTFNEQEEAELKRKINSEENSDNSILEQEDDSFNYEKYDLVLSPSKGILIFLLEPGDIIFVKPSVPEIEENDGSEEDKLTKKQEILANTPSLKATIKSLNFESDFSQIIIFLENGSLGIVEEKEMVKVKGFKLKELNIKNKIKEREEEEKKISIISKELKRNIITLLTLIVIFIFIIYVLGSL